MHLSVNQKWPNYGLDVLNITHAYKSGNTFNECLCVVLEKSLWLIWWNSIYYNGNLQKEILNEF